MGPLVGWGESLNSAIQLNAAPELDIQRLAFFPAGDLHTTVAARREPPTWGFILRNLQAPCGCKPQVDWLDVK